jgi:rod shape-determining protein MreC
MAIIVGVILIILANILALSITSQRHEPISSVGDAALFIIAPLQDTFTGAVRFAKNVWNQYFYLVSASKENERLKKALSRALEESKQLKEVELSNIRFRKLLGFQKATDDHLLAAEVIGKDPSPWFKAIVIDKGQSEGVKKGMPVVVPEGIVGQVVEASSHYSKVLLIIDQNSAVDALVQRTRARGIIEGESEGKFVFKYVLRKDDVKIGDTIVSSGLDGIYPKGLYIGRATEVVKRTSGIFQQVSVTPFVDFERLEEVLITLSPPGHE